MRIAQIILPTASQYERKSQRADYAALAERHEVLVVPLEEAGASGAQVAHVYASGALPRPPFRRFPIPYVSSANLPRSRWTFGKSRLPGYVVGPIPQEAPQSGHEVVGEAVEDLYFGEGLRRAEAASRDVRTVGSFARPGLRNMVEQTLARIHRFRDDVQWIAFDHVPAPDDLAGVDAWADPAIDETDFDGFVAEALVLGLPVVASRTAINLTRLENGRTGFLVPPRDPNEMTHAILTALFKREAAEGKQFAARQTASKFRARQRIRVLTHIYETLIP